MTWAKFETIFMAIAADAVSLYIICKGLLLGLIDNDEKVASCRKDTQFKTRMQKAYPTHDQNDQNRYRLKTIPFGASHTYITHIGQYPPGM